ncbi:tellurium resistance protein TerD [Bacillus sp. V-88]|uniref:TerD family protein n=1 Tax=Rossellomorea vietnamensis TaxID=218284 RepID=UPI0009A89637|nr:TerD family protein [Rossellomorea vietnamensis]MCC5804364.1 TerD family protein [Rossellomorea vietnamensis]OXS64561.1 chemical-damaging agent resistance protein C [Bacillus sp. DSM 27956]PRX79719.1 tellurium resistance protein TerD [Bacillus sp. V-88]SLK02219.1 tellurium resistance protein TerD [Bacillus sp. V-88]
MAIQLSKGQRIDLTKTNPGLTRAVIGLGWDTNKYQGGHDFDLDASAFLVDANDKCVNDQDFIFYNNLSHPSESVIHTGDNLTGEGEGDDEQLIVDFSKIPSYVHKIGITVTIHDADARRQNFGQVTNAFVRLVDDASDNELLRFDLGEDFSIETAVVVCELYRHGNEWKFSAIGSGFSGGLADLCRNYGLQV